MSVRLTVDVEPELERRVRSAAAARNVSVEEFVEDVLRHELELQSVGTESLDHAWLQSDLSRFGDLEPYEWEAGELDEGEQLVLPTGGGGALALQ